MGVFDYLICEHELPDGFDPTGVLFQTKDTPAQWLETYVIREDGGLIDQESGEDVELHGAIEFHGSNWCGSFGDLCMTEDDQPLWRAEYTAIYDRGALIRIEGGSGPVEGVTHILRANWGAAVAERRDRGLTPQQIALRDLHTEWVHWMAMRSDPFAFAKLPAIQLRLDFLRGCCAWGREEKDELTELCNWSEWLAQEGDLPLDAAELLEKTRGLLAASGTSDV